MIGLGGNVTVELRNRHGDLVRREVTKNHVTASGRNAIRNLLAGRGTPPQYIALGRYTTAVQDTDTSLGFEEMRVPLTRIYTAGARITFMIFIDADEWNWKTALPLTEVGLFSGAKFHWYGAAHGILPAEGGVLIARSLIGGFVKEEEITVTVLWDFDIETESPITAAGREWIRDTICGAGGQITHCALGTGATAPASNDIALETEVFRNGITRTVMQPSKAQFECWLETDQANGNTIHEVGLFSDDAIPYTTAAAGLTTGGGTCVARTVLTTPLVKTVSVSLPFIFELPITSVD